MKGREVCIATGMCGDNKSSNSRLLQPYVNISPHMQKPSPQRRVINDLVHRADGKYVSTVALHIHHGNGREGKLHSPQVRILMSLFTWRKHLCEHRCSSNSPGCGRQKGLHKEGNWVRATRPPGASFLPIGSKSAGLLLSPTRAPGERSTIEEEVVAKAIT